MEDLFFNTSSFLSSSSASSSSSSSISSSLLSEDQNFLLLRLLNLSHLAGLVNVSSSKSELERLVGGLELYLTPVIIVVGILGNALSLAVFSLTHLRRISSSLFLATLSVADILFLASLALVWLEKVDVLLYTSVGWCPAVMYVSRVSGCVAAWSVVSFTAERYVTVHFPLLKDVICTRRRALCAAAVMVSSSFAFYSYVAWSYRVIPMRGPARSLCSPVARHPYFMSAMIGADTLLSCLVPTVAIVVLNASIIRKIRKYQRQNQSVSVRYWSRPACRSFAVYEPNYLAGRLRGSADGELRIRFGAQGRPRNCASDSFRFRNEVPPERSRPKEERDSRPRSLVQHSQHVSAPTDARERAQQSRRLIRSKVCRHQHHHQLQQQHRHQRCYRAERHFSYHGVVDGGEREGYRLTDCHRFRPGSPLNRRTSFGCQLETVGCKKTISAGSREAAAKGDNADCKRQFKIVGCMSTLWNKKRSDKIRSSGRIEDRKGEFQKETLDRARVVDKVNFLSMTSNGRAVVSTPGRPLACRPTAVSRKVSKRLKRSPSDRLRCLGDDRVKRVLKNRNQYRTAKMLLTLSSLTVLLNLPTYAFRIQSVVCDLIGSCRHFYQLSRISQLIYFLNFAVNFFVYSACARQFRVELRRLCTKARMKFVKFFLLVHKNLKSFCSEKTIF